MQVTSCVLVFEYYCPGKLPPVVMLKIQIHMLHTRHIESEFPEKGSENLFF